MPEIESEALAIENPTDLTPHEKAMLDAGKKMLTDSIDVGRDFCKTMMTTALGAIPIYLALLQLVIPKDTPLHRGLAILLLSPNVFFIISSILFAIGYLPKTASLDLNNLDLLSSERSKILKKRQTYSWLGFCILLAAILFASIVIVKRAWI